MLLPFFFSTIPVAVFMPWLKVPDHPGTAPEEITSILVALGHPACLSNDITKKNKN